MLASNAPSSNKPLATETVKKTLSEPATTELNPLKGRSTASESLEAILPISKLTDDTVLRHGLRAEINRWRKSDAPGNKSVSAVTSIKEPEKTRAKSLHSKLNKKSRIPQKPVEKKIPNLPSIEVSTYKSPAKGRSTAPPPNGESRRKRIERKLSTRTRRSSWMRVSAPPSSPRNSRQSDTSTQTETIIPFAVDSAPPSQYSGSSVALNASRKTRVQLTIDPSRSRTSVNLLSESVDKLEHNIESNDWK